MRKIIIVGAGISGLSLAHFLQKGEKYDVTILERDTEFNSERQGFSLTMQANTEQILKEYNLYDEIRSLGLGVTTQVFLTNTGEVLYQNTENDTRRFNYPLPRQSLRKVFLDKLQNDPIKWNMKVTTITGSYMNGFTVLAESEGTVHRFEADIVVACDGINSPTRKKFFPNLKLNDLKLCNVYGITKLDDLDEDEKSKFFGTEVQVFDGNLRFFSKPFDEPSGKQMWELTWPIDEKGEFVELYERYARGEDIRSDALTKCQEKIKTFTMPWLHKFFLKSEPSDVIVHPLSDLDPNSFDVQSIPFGLFMIGDVIHPMSPYKGMGANESFLDAYNLAKFLQESELLAEDTFRKFTKDMIERTAPTVLRSREITKFYHSPDVIDKEKLSQFKKWKTSSEKKI